MPSLICGFSAGVLLVVPFLSNSMCCLIVPAAAIISLFLFKKGNRLERKITSKEGMLLGLFTGLFAALFASTFDILITFISHTNQLVQTLPEIEEAFSDFSENHLFKQALTMMGEMAVDIQDTGFSPLYALTVILNNFTFYVILGFFAGLAGINLVNRNNSTNISDNQL